MATSVKKRKSRKSFFYTVVILIFLLVIYLIDPTILDSEQGVELNNFHISSVNQGLPDYDNYNDYMNIAHNYYTVTYMPKYKDPYAVSYILTKKMVSGKHYSRDNDHFEKDPMLSSNYSLSSDYTRTGYDRGHMCPSGDMAFSEEAQAETFFMSNITPQKPKFNRGIWKELEEKVRDWAKKNDSLYVVVGAVYSKRPKRIGANKVAVPSKFYKVVVDISKKDGYKAIAFLLKNYNYPDSTNFMNYAITVDSLEKLLNINFFANYSDSIIEPIESHLNKKLWE